MTSNSSSLTQSSALSTQYSISPNGESFPLPKPEDYEKEFDRLKSLVAKHRKEGHEIVVVLGVWSYQTLMGFEDDIFKITPLAIDIYDFAASYPEH